MKRINKNDSDIKEIIKELEEHPHYDKWDASLYFFKFNYGK